MRGGLIRRGQCKAGSARSAMQCSLWKAAVGGQQWKAGSATLVMRALRLRRLQWEPGGKAGGTRMTVP